jgi:hypothetical protein
MIQKNFYHSCSTDYLNLPVVTFNVNDTSQWI